MMHKKRLASILLSICSIALGILLYYSITTGSRMHPFGRSPSEAAQKLITDCANSNNFTDCSLRFFSALPRAESFDFTLQTLDKAKILRPELNNCHLIAHAISRSEVAKNPENWAKLFESVNPTLCGGGFVHGVLEEYLYKNPTAKIDSALITKICDEHSHSEVDVANCVHSLGHLALLQSNYDISKALQVCDQTPPDLNQRTCYSGIYMEYTTRVNGQDHGWRGQMRFDNIASVIDMQNKCNEVAGLAQQSCWGEMARVFEIYYRSDQDKVIKGCKQAPDIESYKSCAFFASSLLFDNPKFTPDEINFACDFIKDNISGYNDCRLTFFSSLIFNTPSITPNIVQYCNGVDSSFKEACFTQIGTVLALHGNTIDKSKLCEDADSRYKNLCEFK